eukprot:scaffold10974_cov207-Skeletonema_dohrnii-CCMP3373.AAC.2
MQTSTYWRRRAPTTWRAKKLSAIGYILQFSRTAIAVYTGGIIFKPLWSFTFSAQQLVGIRSQVRSTSMLRSLTIQLSPGDDMHHQCIYLR